MKKEISPLVAIGIVAALAIAAIVGGVLWNRAANPVFHLGPGDSFDMKTGKVVPKSDAAPGSAALGSGATTPAR